MPGGRPTKYRREMCEVAEAFLSEGYSKEALAGNLRIAKDTLYRWIEEHGQFSDAIKRGEAAGQVMWETMGLDGAQGKIEGFNAAAWIFNMKNRHGWRDKQEVTGGGGVALVINVVKHGEK